MFLTYNFELFGTIAYRFIIQWHVCLKMGMFLTYGKQNNLKTVLHHSISLLRRHLYGCSKLMPNGKTLKFVLHKSQPRSQSSLMISGVTSPVKLVGKFAQDASRYRAWFQASSYRLHKSMSFRMECHVPLKLIFQTYRKLPLIFLGLYIFVRSFRILYEGAFNRNYSKSASKQANQQCLSVYVDCTFCIFWFLNKL